MSTSRAKPVKAQSTSPGHPTAKPPVADRGRTLDLAIGCALFLSLFVAYAQVGRFNFLNYDDDILLYDNAFVKAGLTFASIKWAFTAVVVGNWMPMTLLSHLVDVQLFGLRSGMHHLVNVMFHGLSSVLLFVVLKRATAARWPSAFVAFIFALHPLHVQSVAWVSERKDVLSTFFWFIALYAYLRYAERPSLSRYLLVVAPFCLGLMSKPMLVTFPFTLLLFDVWPLRRFKWPAILLEKLPLIVLSAVASAVTWFAQQSDRTVYAGIPLDTRVANALIAYLTYLLQAFWPARLAVLYPYQKSPSGGEVVLAAIVLLAVTTLAIRVWRTRPYYAVGWFWYLGTLVPVIGLVQVGTQSHADRYTYVPLIGISVMLAWGAVEVACQWPGTKLFIAVAGGLACVACLAAASSQVDYWQNSGTLFQRTLDVTDDNWLAQFNLGQYEMKEEQRYTDAIPHFETALRILPNYIAAIECLGFCLMKTGRTADAIPYLETMVRLKPNLAEAQVNLGEALAMLPGRDLEAIPHFRQALLSEPNNPETNNDLGACLLNNGRAPEAIPYFEAAVRLKPDSVDARSNLALALSANPARVPDAIAQYEAILRLKPDYAAAHRTLGNLLAQRGRTEAALAHLKLAVKLDPSDYLNQRDIGLLLAATPGRQSAAIPYLETVQRIHPEPAVAQTLARLRK